MHVHAHLLRIRKTGQKRCSLLATHYYLLTTCLLTTHLEDGPEALLELVAELLAHLAEGILLHLVRVGVRLRVRVRVRARVRVRVRVRVKGEW